MRMLALLCMFLALGWATECRARTREHHPSAISSSDPADLDERGFRVVEGPPFVRSITVGAFRVVLEKTTFAQIQVALGEGSVVTSGDAGDFMARLCYRSADPKNPVYIVFESGAMGGGTDVTGFELFRAGARPALQQPCGELRVGAEMIKVDGAFSMNASKHEVTSRFGSAQAASADTLYYRHDRKHRAHSVPSDSDWDEMSFVDLAFEGQQLIWMSAWKVSAN